MDVTLHLRRAFLGALFGAARSLPGRTLLSFTLRAAMPPVARLAGEELLSRPRRVLAFTAHPDDLEFFAGGTLWRLAKAGSRIHACVLSDGEKHGSYERLDEVRRSEQEQAARILGYASIRFFGLPDFALPEDPRLERIVDGVWQEVRPEVVLAFDPQELIVRMANRDHKALGRTVMDVARRRMAEGTRVYFYGTRQANVVVDLDGVIEEKLRAVESHRSQLVYLSPEEYREGFRLLSRAWASGSGCRYAEGLYRLF